MFIDMHVHTRRAQGYRKPNGNTYATPLELLRIYDKIGVEKAVILPAASPECQYTPQSMEDVLEICAQSDGRFIPFCNVDPRMLKNSSDAPLGEYMAYYKERGCKGIGEITANLSFDNPLVENLFCHCEQQGMPVIFHVAPTLGGCYGLFDEPGLPLLEKALQRFPNLLFLGHSQPFWAEIAPLKDPEARNGYPKGKVQEPGRVVKLMQTYPNLHGDLSAGSGHNAVSRDEAFGIWFMETFQDRLYFGTDICSPKTATPLAEYLPSLLAHDKITKTCFEKIARGNAERLLGLR